MTYYPVLDSVTDGNNLLKKMPEIPTSPVSEIIDDKSIERILGWCEYFKGLSASKRIRVIRPKEAEFDGALQVCKEYVLRSLSIGQDWADKVKWPKKEKMAFIVCMALDPAEKNSFLPEDVYVFCHSDEPYAFGVQFGFSYEDEEGPDHGNFLLSRPLEWPYCAKIIRDHLMELSELIPEIPRS